MTTTAHYYLDRDGYGAEIIARGDGPDDMSGQIVVYRRELDRMDPVLWPTLVAALCARTPDETATLEDCAAYGDEPRTLRTPPPRRRLCAHADDGRGAHWLEPGEQCPAPGNEPMLFRVGDIVRNKRTGVHFTVDERGIWDSAYYDLVERDGATPVAQEGEDRG